MDYEIVDCEMNVPGSLVYIYASAAMPDVQFIEVMVVKLLSQHIPATSCVGEKRYIIARLLKIALSHTRRKLKHLSGSQA